jgi:hypothetical protein
MSTVSFKTLNVQETGMKKALTLILALAMVVLLVSGCSKEPAPTSSSAETVAVDDGPIDVLIGYAGKQPTRMALAAVDGVIKREYENFPVIYASLSKEAIEELKNNPDVLYVEEDQLRYATAETLDWGVDRIDAEYVFENSSYTGAGIKSAAIGTTRTVMERTAPESSAPTTMTSASSVSPPDAICTPSKSDDPAATMCRIS